jgi:hypothetical protein
MAVEPVHAVIYFAPECRDSLRAIGLRRFWPGYFGARAAPLGPVGSATVSALFFNFHPSMVSQSIPEAWSVAELPAIIEARRSGAGAALRRIAPDVDQTAESVLPALERVIAAADGSGRALFGANRQLPRSGDPVESLWQACTTLREHRGDGHVAALTAAGLGGCEALVLFSATQQVPAEMFHQSRGWSEEEWENSRRALEDRGLLVGAEPSAAGTALREWVEGVTDDLAAAPLGALDVDESMALIRALAALADRIVGSGVIPFPNPIGLPGPGSGGPGGPG